MLPLGFALPALLILAVALAVAVRDLRAAASRLGTSGAGPLLANAGEVMMIVATIGVFLQGRPAGLVLAPAAGYVLFFGGAVLVFTGMSMESRRGRS